MVEAFFSTDNAPKSPRDETVMDVSSEDESPPWITHDERDSLCDRLGSVLAGVACGIEGYLNGLGAEDAAKFSFDKRYILQMLARLTKELQTTFTVEFAPDRSAVRAAERRASELEFTLLQASGLTLHGSGLTPRWPAWVARSCSRR